MRGLVRQRLHRCRIIHVRPDANLADREVRDPVRAVARPTRDAESLFLNEPLQSLPQSRRGLSDQQFRHRLLRKLTTGSLRNVEYRRQTHADY